MNRALPLHVFSAVALVATAFGQTASPRLSSVETAASDRPGYETKATLRADDGSVIATLDLLAGERIVGHTPDQIVFVRADGSHFRLKAPFRGRPQPFDPDEDQSAPLADDSAMRNAPLVGGVTGAAGQFFSWFLGSGSDIPAPTPEPAPQETPRPAPTPRSTPSEESRPVWTVIALGDRLQCIDARTGSTQSSINLSGTIVNGPVVSGDYCTVTIQSGTGLRSNIYKLPSLSLQTSRTL